MSAKIILSVDGSAIREFNIEKQVLTIGRKPDNDIQINDITVSGNHARITTLLGNSFIEDLGSSNGTLVNGSPITKILLMQGDRVQIGSHQLSYAKQAKDDIESSMFIKAEISNNPCTSENEPSHERASKVIGGVKLLNGPQVNRVMELRKPLNTLGFNGVKMASIANTPAGYAIHGITPRGGWRNSNRIFLNGQPIGSTPIRLKEKDIIELAEFKMEFVHIV